jgi:hypothetical protein
LICQLCQRDDACWLDQYTDRAICNTCCPDRSEAYGQAFVKILTPADVRRLQDREDRYHAGNGGERQ